MKTWLAALLVLLATLASAPSAFAEDRRAEGPAKEALRRAATDFRVSAFDDAIAHLERAIRDCGTSHCAVGTRAALNRDLGVMQFRKGYRRDAAVSFVNALRIDPSIEMSPTYEAPDVKRDWVDAREEAALAAAAPTTGDFLHTPVPEQAVSTPVPIYVEYAGETPLASVAVKYKGNAMADFKRLPLSRVGNGWGGLVPCGDVSRGPLRYYVQGFDAHNEPIASSGDPKHPFYVRIRPTLLGSPPSLPGAAPPAKCGESVASTSGTSSERARSSEGESCEDDSQCGSGKCSAGHCVTPQAEEESAAPKDYPRLWIGVAGSLDIVPLSSGDDVCILSGNGTPQGAGYYCTNTDGSDFPQRRTTEENNAIIAGKGGQVGSGPVLGDVRVMASIDYALSVRFLLGARVGYVLNAYPGKGASHDGHAFAAPLHLELRGTLLFGEAPLARAGVAPMLLLAAGAADFDAGTSTLVSRNDVSGQVQEKAWKTAGPIFVALGAGARVGLSPRAAFVGAVKATSAFGGTSTFIAISPEIALQYGF